jgi:hypothetical protein
MSSLEAVEAKPIPQKMINGTIRRIIGLRFIGIVLKFVPKTKVLSKIVQNCEAAHDTDTTFCAFVLRTMATALSSNTLGYFSPPVFLFLPKNQPHLIFISTKTKP